jgi:cullin 1
MAGGNAHLLGEVLYQSLGDYMARHLAEVRHRAEDLMDEALLKYFVVEWERYRKVAVYINTLFRYLNRHWVKREMDEGKKVHDIFTLILLKWRTEMFDFMHETAMKVVLELTRKQRSGDVVGFSEIRQFMNSFSKCGARQYEHHKLTMICSIFEHSHRRRQYA